MWKPLHPSTVFSLAMCMCAGGCALTAEQKAAVMRFSEATIAFTDLASQEFVQSRADVVEMNKLRNQLDRAGGLKPRVEGEELDGALTLERVRERKEAMAALREYAELLETLTTSSNAAEIRAAAESFTASLKGEITPSGIWKPNFIYSNLGKYFSGAHQGRESTW